MTDRELLDEQVAYYRARAGEYDATSSPAGDPFSEAGEEIRAALRAFGARGRVLEVAAGTGQWTGILAETAAALVVTDSSPEMLALNEARTGRRQNVRYAVADAFALDRVGGAGAFDAVVFGFFLSHVPVGSFAAFWDGVATVLAPGGRVFFVDEGRHGHWQEDWIDEPAGVVRRMLTTGAEHRAVKVHWAPDDLVARLRAVGWEASVRASEPFYWGTAVRGGPRRRPDGSAE